MNPVVIGVFPPDQFSRYQRLLDGLSELYSTQFEPRAEGNWAGCNAALLLGVSRLAGVRIAGSGLRCLAFLNEQPVAVKSSAAAIDMASIPYLVQCFRGRTLPDQTVARVSPLIAGNVDQVVARKGEDILWIHTSAGSTTVDLVATECPCLSDQDFLFQHFQRDNWVKLFPLMHFLRELSAWDLPPLRATFMFDDPNLHWKSYGYIRYDQLTHHAKQHNYHVSVATIPLDTWFTHKPTAALFHENKAQLSVVVHGNNHIAGELAQAYSDQQRLALGTMALRRIKRFEEISGLEVARVMVAPHGACTEKMAQFLLRTGFEAACISRQSLMKYNKEKKWSSTIGLNVAEFVADGFPVISRFGLSKHREVDFHIAAFLGKPIILDGHHEDLSQGLDLLRELAELVNSFGKIQWMSMKAIARSNFCMFRDGDLLRIKMYSRIVQFRIPHKVKRLAIEKAWINDQDTETMIFREGEKPFTTIHGRQREPISVSPTTEIEIAVFPSDSRNPDVVSASRTPFWAVARRSICEARDRLKPIVDRLRTLVFPQSK